MIEIETRIRENYPTILMTILSLIVALVFENLIGSMKEQAILFERSPEALFLWVQCLFMVVGPLAFWFAHALFSCSVRPVFAREDAIVPVLAAIAYNVLASNLGAQHAVWWLGVAGAIAGLGFIALGQFGRRYHDDPALAPAAGVHQRSRCVLLAAGVVLGAAALALGQGAVGFGPATLATALAIPLVASGVFVFWYREWRSAVNLDAAPRG